MTDVMVLAANGQNLASGKSRSPGAGFIHNVNYALPTPFLIAFQASPAPAEPTSRLITMLYRNGPIPHSTAGCQVP